MNEKIQQQTKRRGRPRSPIPDFKACGRCKIVKPISEFGWFAKRERPKCYCRECENEVNKTRNWTPEQKERRRSKQHENWKQVVAKNICPDCRERETGGATACHECAERRKQEEAERRIIKQSKRVCPGCNERPLSLRRRLCDQCADTKGERFRTYQRQWRNAQKLETMQKYGGAICACCGEVEFGFLTMDHINNDGAQHRKMISESEFKGMRIYPWLKKHGFPPGFQVLCFNCNCGRQINGGICPHKQRPAVHGLRINGTVN